MSTQTLNPKDKFILEPYIGPDGEEVQDDVEDMLAKIEEEVKQTGALLVSAEVELENDFLDELSDDVSEEEE